VRRLALFYWSATIVYGIVIYIASSQPDLAVKLPHYTDKLIHAGEYGLFSYLLFYSLIYSCYQLGERGVIPLVVGLALLFAMADEYHQSFVVGRQSSIGDLLADLLGVILMQLVIFLSRRYLYYDGGLA